MRVVFVDQSKRTGIFYHGIMVLMYTAVQAISGIQARCCRLSSRLTNSNSYSTHVHWVHFDCEDHNRKHQSTGLTTTDNTTPEFPAGCCITRIPQGRRGVPSCRLMPQMPRICERVRKLTSSLSSKVVILYFLVMAIYAGLSFGLVRVVGFREILFAFEEAAPPEVCLCPSFYRNLYTVTAM